MGDGEISSSASACSHSAMPSSARLVYISTIRSTNVHVHGPGPTTRLWSASLRQRRRPPWDRSETKMRPLSHRCAPIRRARRHCRDRQRASDRKTARSRDIVRGQAPIVPSQALNEIHRVGVRRRSARRASAATNWAFSAPASRVTISSCMSKRSPSGLSNRYISGDSACFRRFCPPALAACQAGICAGSSRSVGGAAARIVQLSRQHLAALHPPVPCRGDRRARRAPATRLSGVLFCIADCLHTFARSSLASVRIAGAGGRL